MAHALIAQGRRNPQAEAIRRLAQRARAIRNRRALAHRPPPDVVEWAHQHFYIVNESGQSQLIQLTRLQQALLRFLLQRTEDGRFRFSTIVWSTIKKSGKTAISAMVARWASETWGRYSEVYCMANDLEQAKGRAYQAIASSLEMTPGFDRARRALPGQWIVLDKTLKNIPSGGTIKAVATDYAGEAGSNPSLTLWCVPTETPVLTADLRWLPAGSLVVGQQLVGFQEQPTGFNLSRTFCTSTVTAFET
ncbi:MAG: hypothetical protein Q8R28_16400, partial [Dehalococcoidia bacterium]|nr:hypothetical protein [Dehalococcoidia bacterium]